MRRASIPVLILVAVTLVPSLVSAQGTLTGTVRDESGAVLPGVTVEASSPALIEKVRVAVSDATGQYLVAGVALNVVQTQAVSDQFGGTRPLPGATITYSFVISATGTGSASTSVFTNDIPANTTYVPGTLRLNSAVLSDAADADAGDFSTLPNARVRVQLGTLTQASGSQTIQFAVTIN